MLRRARDVFAVGRVEFVQPALGDYLFVEYRRVVTVRQYGPVAAGVQYVVWFQLIDIDLHHGLAERFADYPKSGRWPLGQSITSGYCGLIVAGAEKFLAPRRVALVLVLVIHCDHQSPPHFFCFV